MRGGLVLDIVREIRQNPGDASVQNEELDETDEEAAARLAQEAQM